MQITLSIITVCSSSWRVQYIFVKCNKHLSMLFMLVRNYVLWTNIRSDSTKQIYILYEICIRTIFICNVRYCNRCTVRRSVWIWTLHHLSFGVFLAQILYKTSSLLLTTIARCIAELITAIRIYIVLVRSDWHEATRLLWVCLNERNSIKLMLLLHFGIVSIKCGVY